MSLNHDFTRDRIPADESNLGSSAYQRNTLHGSNDRFTARPKPDQNIRVESFHITQEFAIVQSTAVKYLGRHARDAYETQDFFLSFFFFYINIAQRGYRVPIMSARH